jgi:hypothetical protein
MDEKGETLGDIDTGSESESAEEGRRNEEAAEVVQEGDGDPFRQQSPGASSISDEDHAAGENAGASSSPGGPTLKEISENSVRLDGIFSFDAEAVIEDTATMRTKAGELTEKHTPQHVDYWFRGEELGNITLYSYPCLFSRNGLKKSSKDGISLLY